MEEWKSTRYDGYYVSNMGQVKSIKRGRETDVRSWDNYIYSKMINRYGRW